MCGIICIIDLIKKNGSIPLCPEILAQLFNRGPNKYDKLQENHILFCGCVLWQQGAQLISQPATSANYIILLNGDIFNCKKEYHLSDTTWLLQQLEACNNEEDMFRLLRCIYGPFSLIIYNRKTTELYFARDAFGRNSLLIDNNKSYLKILSCSSIPKEASACMELPPIGVYKININNYQQIDIYPWTTNYDCRLILTLELFFRKDINIKDSINPVWLMIKPKPQQEVSFDFYDEILKCDRTNIFPSLLACDNINFIVDKLICLLMKSIAPRIKFTTKYCSLCLTQIYSQKFIVTESTNFICNHSKIGIFFSGGVDCSILAVLAHKYCDILDSIDLINVSFESCMTKKGDPIDWNVPDRCSARASYLELQKLFPNRKWNLIEINVTREELEDRLKTNLKNLIYPLNTIIDESLGAVFWFAARGQGFINNLPYKSNCRVILLGIGADELFGGYKRHRNAYNRTDGNHIKKIEAVRYELDFDWQRLPYRNLGRDDRAIGDHGKTARAPFIEEDIVNFVTHLNVSQKCCFNLEDGIGDKLLLRLCAYKLGLRYSTTLKKRAVQFGSKIANRKQNANDVSKYLLTNNYIEKPAVEIL